MAESSYRWVGGGVLADQPWNFNFRAAIHDDFEPCFFRSRGAFLVGYAKLHPDIFCADGNSFIADRPRCFRIAEDIDHVDFLRNVGKLRINRFAQKFLPGKARSEEHTSELQSLMRISYAVFCSNKHTI